MYFILFIHFLKGFLFFTIEDNVCCGFVIYSFYYVEVVSRGIHVIELPAHTGTQQTLSKGWSSLLPLQYMDGLREMPRP